MLSRSTSRFPLARAPALRNADVGHCRPLLWVGALCWNIASQKLPTVILGPLIVFETLAGLLYTFLLRQSMPPLLTLSGILLLVVGVVYAVCSRPQNRWSWSGSARIKNSPYPKGVFLPIRCI